MTLDELLDYSQAHEADVHLHEARGIYVRAPAGRVTLLSPGVDDVARVMRQLTTELGCPDGVPMGTITRERRWSGVLVSGVPACGSFLTASRAFGWASLAS